MDLRQYQRLAAETDQSPGEGEKDLAIPLLGLAGETGSLLTEYKKMLRDGPSYRIFDDRIAEEIGDILWYISNIATKAHLDLDNIAEQNIRKTRGRWNANAPTLPGMGRRLFDQDFPEHEQIPRQFRLEVAEHVEGDATKVTIVFNGQPVGDPLTDNAYEDDGYRYHDVFHFAYLAVLGWSPVARKLLKLKRKSDKKVDEVEDGARAQVLEEAISALVFQYAEGRSYLEEVKTIDFSLLQTLAALTGGLEVRAVSLKEWEDAILQGFAVWRAVTGNKGGIVDGDLNKKTFVLKATHGEV